MARHHESYRSKDHGVGDVARQNADLASLDQFGTGGRTQNPPEDYGTAHGPEPFDRDFHPRQRYGERDDREDTQSRGYRGLGPKNYERPDERIQGDVCERLWDADDVDASDVTVEVKDAVITLGGSVGQRKMKHRIEDIADACPGVKDIRNEIRVRRRNE